MKKPVLILASILLLCKVYSQFPDYVTWKYKTDGRVYSHPVLHDNTLYFGSNDQTFYAVNVEDKNEKWTFKATNNVQCQALIVDTIIYFSDVNFLYALSVADGSLIWKHKIPNPIENSLFDYWDYHHPAAVLWKNTVLFATGNGNIYGLEKLSGQFIMQVSADDSAAIRSTPVVYNDRIYFGDWKGVVYAFDLVAQKQLWKHRTYAKQLYPTFGQVNTKMIIYDDILLFGARNPELQALNIQNGEVIWNFIEEDGGWISGDPYIVNDTMFIGGSDCHKMYAFNVYTGKKYWEFEFVFNNFSGIIDAGSKILFTSGNAYANTGENFGRGYLYAVSKTDGSLLNFAQVGGNIFNTPLLNHGEIYVTSDDHFLYAIDYNSFINSKHKRELTGYQSFEILNYGPNPFADSIEVNYKLNFNTKIRFEAANFNSGEKYFLGEQNLEAGDHSFTWNGKELEDGYYEIEISSGIYAKNFILLKKDSDN